MVFIKKRRVERASEQASRRASEKRSGRLKYCEWLHMAAACARTLRFLALATSQLIIITTRRLSRCLPRRRRRYAR